MARVTVTQPDGQPVWQTESGWDFARSNGYILADAVRDWFVNHFKTRDARLHKMLGV